MFTSRALGIDNRLVDTRFGFPIAAGLGLFTSARAVGVWWGLLGGLLTAAVLLGGRLYWLIGRQGAGLPELGET